MSVWWKVLLSVKYGPVTWSIWNKNLITDTFLSLKKMK